MKVQSLTILAQLDRFWEGTLREHFLSADDSSIQELDWYGIIDHKGPCLVHLYPREAW